MDNNENEIVMLVSRVSHPVKVTYNNVDFMLAPKQKTKREFIRSKLGTIDTKEIFVVR